MKTGHYRLARIAIAALLLGSISSWANGQELPAPADPPSATAPEENASAPAVSESPQITPTPTPLTARNVRISFLPPPLEGKISLGIYDAQGELVRILHREAPFDEFTVGADALITKWDGKDDRGNDRAAGKYHARGFLVGPLKIEEIPGPTDVPTDANPGASVQVKLMPNPLSKSGGAVVDLVVASDDKGVYLRTTDGLPLLTISQRTNLSRVWVKKNGDKTADIFLEESGKVAPLRLSSVDKMMSFDCGDLELK